MLLIRPLDEVDVNHDEIASAGDSVFVREAGSSLLRAEAQADKSPKLYRGGTPISKNCMHPRDTMLHPFLEASARPSPSPGDDAHEEAKSASTCDLSFHAARSCAIPL